MYENTPLYQDAPNEDISRNTEDQLNRAEDNDLSLASLAETVNENKRRIAILEGGKPECSVGDLKIVSMER